MKRVFILLAALVGVLPASAAEFDGGGRVGDYLDFVASSARVQISGTCASACTLKLGARGACVASDARLLFHAPRDADGRVDRLAALMMLQAYPPRIRAWAKQRRALEGATLTEMTGVQAIALGEPDCARR